MVVTYKEREQTTDVSLLREAIITDTQGLIDQLKEYLEIIKATDSTDVCKWDLIQYPNRMVSLAVDIRDDSLILKARLFDDSEAIEKTLDSLIRKKLNFRPYDFPVEAKQYALESLINSKAQERLEKMITEVTDGTRTKVIDSFGNTLKWNPRSTDNVINPLLQIDNQGTNITPKAESGLPENAKHYQRFAQDAIEMMQIMMTPDEFRGYVWGNVIKYTLRSGAKDSLREEMEKIKTYAGWVIDAIDGKTIVPPRKQK